MGIDIVAEVEYIIDEPFDIDEKVGRIGLLLMEYIQDDVHQQLGVLAEDILFGRIEFPKVIELQCRLD